MKSRWRCTPTNWSSCRRASVAWQGACADAATHRALEQVFDHRIAIHPLAGQWVALPK
jgi:hypothetical protein